MVSRSAKLERKIAHKNRVIDLLRRRVCRRNKVIRSLEERLDNLETDLQENREREQELLLECGSHLLEISAEEILIRCFDSFLGRVPHESYCWFGSFGLSQRLSTAGSLFGQNATEAGAFFDRVILRRHLRAHSKVPFSVDETIGTCFKLTRRCRRLRELQGSSVLILKSKASLFRTFRVI